MGRIEEAKEYAILGLEVYSDNKKDRKDKFGDYFLLEEVVYCSLLALAKGLATGIEMLETEMCGELCSRCNYCECIDAYIELVELYDFIGNKERALEMAEKGFKVSPYDLDIISAKKRLKEELGC